MEIENNEQVGQPKRFDQLYQVTPLSKYLAMALFIAMPFIGGWVGYRYMPEKVVEVEKIVEVEGAADIEESLQTPFPSATFSDLYTYELPDGWWIEPAIEYDGLSIFAPSPLKIEEPYDDENGYYNDTKVSAYRSVDKLFRSELHLRDSVYWYTNLLSIYIANLYPSDFNEELKEESLSTLSVHSPVSLFKTNNQRFQGISRINTHTQDYSFAARYELRLIDTVSGDPVTLSVHLAGEEINEIRSMLANSWEEDQGEYSQARAAFFDLINSKSRDELSFGYLMNDLDNFANSLVGKYEWEDYF